MYQKTIIKKKAIGSFIVLLIAIALFIFPTAKIPRLDSATDFYFSEAMSKAGAAYATCRIINASVSVIKDSTLQLEPAGVGMSLAVGQTLDPVDDLTERLSDVLVMAIVSLGVQKLAYEIGVSLALPLIAICLLAWSLLMWFSGVREAKKIIQILLTILIAARICLPVSSIANNYIYQHYFTKQISETNDELGLCSAGFDKFKKISLPEVDGVLGTINNSATFLKHKISEFKKILAILTENMGDMIENLLRLTFLYVGIFLIQVLFLPLLVFWLLVKILNSLFCIDISAILNDSR